MLAVLELTGAGAVRGCYVAEDDPRLPPDPAFICEFDQMAAEKMLADTIDNVCGWFTWDDVLRKLARAQNLLVTIRYLGETNLSAPQLLAAARMRERAHVGLGDLLAPARS